MTERTNQTLARDIRFRRRGVLGMGKSVCPNVGQNQTLSGKRKIRRVVNPRDELFPAYLCQAGSDIGLAL